jgi:hypothetical protein
VVETGDFVADISAISETLAWQPAWSLNAGITDVVERVAEERSLAVEPEPAATTPSHAMRQRISSF